ncbi:craniofacial development protein 2-like [Elysia marginata]|uniref:Craniofacial development protein 2-like n=1 Tax=Elysia marginata TaxID=1093978 RepID=A0AAV4FEN5_9GAST|nr:craniofacial development protein 2-like [Elysia marginata]
MSQLSPGYSIVRSRPNGHPKSPPAKLSFNAINDRILVVKLNTKKGILNIIQVYAPTSACSLEEIEEFYNNLQNAKDKISERELCIVMGDMNAKVGEGEDRECGIGPFGLGIRNERGDMLATFCQTNNLTIANTLFEQPKRRRYTWISPDHKIRNQIDYIMVDKGQVSAVLRSKTLPGAYCDTDHMLVITILRLKQTRYPRVKQAVRFDTDKLSDPETTQIIKVELSNRFDDLLKVWEKEDSIPEIIWNSMKETLKVVCEDKLGRKKKRKKKPFISDEVVQLASQKSQARKARKFEEYKRLKAEIKQ